MTTPATHNGHETTTARVLCGAFARREQTWQLGCTTGPGHKPRARPVTARHQAPWLQAVAQATKRFGLPDTAPVVRGDAAGRAGCWLHRFLPAHGSTTAVVESSSLAVQRRKRRATSEGVDGRQVVRMLRRYASGAREVWRVVHGPSVEAEEQRQLPRALATLRQERARTLTRLKGWLRRQGRRLTRLTKGPAPREALRLWAGSPMPQGLRQRGLRG
jgi:transposase